MGARDEAGKYKEDDRKLIEYMESFKKEPWAANNTRYLLELIQ